MNNTVKASLLILFISGALWAQDESPRVQSIRQGWEDHTSFQRKELISFINFLYDQEYYERARLALFEFLFLLPNDPLRGEAYYYIGDCYERNGQMDLALKYYGQALAESDSGSVVYTAALNRRTHAYLTGEDWDRVLELTAGSDDPYQLVYRGYAQMNRLDFVEARLAFRAAEERFDNRVYSRRLDPILKALDIVSGLESKSKARTILAGLVPGGGRAYLKGWKSALGVAISTGVLAVLVTRSLESNDGNLGFREPVGNWVPDGSSYGDDDGSSGGVLPRTIHLKGQPRMILIPAAVIGTGIYIGSIWGAVSDIQAQNIRLKERAVSRITRRYSPERFGDYSQPDFY